MGGGDERGEWPADVGIGAGRYVSAGGGSVPGANAEVIGELGLGKDPVGEGFLHGRRVRGVPGVGEHLGQLARRTVARCFLLDPGEAGMPPFEEGLGFPCCFASRGGVGFGAEGRGRWLWSGRAASRRRDGVAVRHLEKKSVNSVIIEGQGVVEGVGWTVDRIIVVGGVEEVGVGSVEGKA